MAKDIIKAVHETVNGLHKAGVMDAVTLRDFDALCLAPVKTYTAAQHLGVQMFTNPFLVLLDHRELTKNTRGIDALRIDVQ